LVIRSVSTVVHLGLRQSLSLDEVLQKVVSLDVEVVDGLVHSLDSALRRADQILVSHDLVDQLLLGEFLQNLLRVRLLVFPLVEVDGQRVVHAVQGVTSQFLGSLSALHVGLPLVESLRDDVEVSILEEETDHRLLHVGPLLLGLLGQVFVDVLGLVARLDQLFSEAFRVPLRLVPLQNHISHCVHVVRQVESLNVVSPPMEEMLHSVLGSVHHGPVKELLLEDPGLRAVLESIQSVLHPPLEHPIQDLPNASRAVLSRLLVPLPHGLGSVVPMLEALGQVEALHSPEDLARLAHHLGVLVRVVLDGFEAGSHDLAVPLLLQLGRSLSEVLRSLHALEPLPQRFSLP